MSESNTFLEKARHLARCLFSRLAGFMICFMWPVLLALAVETADNLISASLLLGFITDGHFYGL